ncbi:type II secretory pathway, component PulD [Chthonomonas calidirosea]|uniref:Type II secretory pathway, component PulD n=1 Tax=Chthonomonas calidirosea (strain DSM 23976 / ICMP 18418 / T49) TaxID=1303518 RepID=S0ES84_CHTCT|nr:secretin N-terminal domain-containing protein [Chthonomonas calidirosea]CCW34036.1 Type II secretory pathway, component PulD [Chthonomonas calidirosea T49]CEK15940.1 type II secretory pathway, component PulD [Chthonomonas calidirosea]
MRQNKFSWNHSAKLSQGCVVALLTLASLPVWAQGQQGPPNGRPPAQGGNPPFRIEPRGGQGFGGAGGFGGFRQRGSGNPFAAVAGRQGMRFSFDFRGSDIMNVLQFYAQMANVEIVADPSLSGKVTIINPTPVTLDQAFTILQQVLAVRGFSAIENNGVISIEPFATAARNTTLINPGINPNGPTPVDPRNQVMTQVIPLENADAKSLAQDLQPLINQGASLIGVQDTNSLVVTDTASNVQRILALVQSLDKSSYKTELRVYPLRHANATDVADVINNVFKQMSGTTTPAANEPGRPGPPQFQPGQQPQVQQNRPAVFAVADTRTNSVLVVASPDNQERVAHDIIDRLDADQNALLQTVVRKINFADATDVANLVNQVLSNQYGATQANQQNASFQQRAFGGFFNPFFGNQQQQTVESTDPFGKVVADPRTNSVLITATPDRMQTINKLIDALDQEVPAESTTFIFPLKNANAADVAYALGQAFGTGQQNGFGNFNNFFFEGGGASTNNQVGLPKINRQLGNNALFTRSAAPPQPPNAPDSAAPQGQADAGSVESGSSPGTTDPYQANTLGQEPTRQFFRPFGGGFFGQQRGLGQNTGPQYGRGRNGEYANLLQLQNNVYVTPSPTGDAVIVTTTPDNYEAVKELIDQLDVVPRQVMIKLIVAEVSLDKDEKLGFALNGLFKDLFGKTNTATGQIGLQAPGFNTGANGLSLDPLAEGAQFVLNGANYTALLQALESDNRVKVMATPTVFTSNGQEALVNVVERIPYISGQTISGLSNFVTNNISTVPVGYQIDMTPRITRDGLVTIDAVAQASTLKQFETLGSGANASQYPVVDERNIDTEITVQSGQTVAIGGLVQNTETLTVNKIPLLSDIPIIGQFFRERERVTNRTELVLFITPVVINSTQEAQTMTQQESKGLVQQLPDLKKEHPDLAPPPASKTTVPPPQK